MITFKIRNSLNKFTMNILKPTFVLIFFLALSCNSTKDSKNAAMEKPFEIKKMIENGFKRGVIVESEKKDNCPYIIEMQDNGNVDYLDPIDLPDKFKKNGIAVWFKFTPSRRVKRCQKANPVILENAIYFRD